MRAHDYNRREIAAGRLTAEHLRLLIGDKSLEIAIRFHQRAHRLVADGKAGSQTQASLDALTRPQRCWPFRMYKTARPLITSRFWTNNTGRNGQILNGVRTKKHMGVDILLPWKEGWGELGIYIYRRRYWCPGPVIACAAGEVHRCRNARNGYRCWIDHGDGDRTGYLHLAELEVENGDVVEMGQRLAMPAPRKIVNPPHVHLELSEVGRYRPRDPEPWLESAVYLPGIGHFQASA